MTSATAAPLAALKVILEDCTAHDFEHLTADLFSRLLGDVRVTVAKSGSQYGADSSTSGHQGRHLRIESKRYQESTPLNPRGLSGEVHQALQHDRLLEAWILASTKHVSENEIEQARVVGQDLGVPILVIDWAAPPAGAGINRLASLCATWPDVVESHIGPRGGELSRELTSFVGNTVDKLRDELASWNLGYFSLREAALRLVASAWQDKAASKALLNQDAAGGSTGVHLIKRLEPLNLLNDWWSSPKDPIAPAAVVGPEGVGKTWVALDWLNNKKDELPIVLLVGAGKFVGKSFETNGGFKELAVQCLREMTNSTRERSYWEARVRALLERPPTAGPAFLLVVDGLNQQPHVQWQALAMSLQSPDTAGKVRLLITSRKHFYEVELRHFSGVNTRPIRVPVERYSREEFAELLLLHGMEEADLSQKLVLLARTPRLFPLILRLKDNNALQADASVHRLLFEYCRDEMQLRIGSELTEDRWTRWLIERATELRDGLKSNGRAPSASTEDQISRSLSSNSPHLSPASVYNQLSDVIDGGFYRPVSSGVLTRHELDPNHATLGLALALLDTLGRDSNSSFHAAQTDLESWLEPIAAIDQVADILQASLAVLSSLGQRDGNFETDALLTTWMNVQNPSHGFERDVEVFGNAFPKSMITVVEQSTLSSRSSAFHFATQALRNLPRNRKEDWAEVRTRMLRWCSPVNLPDKKHVDDTNHYAHHHQRNLLKRIGTASAGARTVLGEELQFSDEHEQDTTTAVAAILEGHDLSDFASVIRRAAVRESVQVEHRGFGWRSVHSLVLYSNVHRTRTQALFVELAEQILCAPVEQGVHPRLRNKVAALLLRTTCDEALEARARDINELFGEGWDYEEHYINDPISSNFPLEFRHVSMVLNAQNTAANYKLNRLGWLIAHPEISLPVGFERFVDSQLSSFPTQDVGATGMANKRDYDFERIALEGARFLPERLCDLWRRLMVDMTSRDGDSKYWAAYHVKDSILIATPTECERYTGLRTRHTLPAYDDAANGWCLQMEILHKPPAEQLEWLYQAHDFRLLNDLTCVVRQVTAEQLLEFLKSHTQDSDRAARIVMAVMVEQGTPDAGALADQLTCYLDCESNELKYLAFEALALCAPEVCGKRLLEMNWSAEGADVFLAHHGSHALAIASRHMDFLDLIDQIAAWKLLDAVALRGSKPPELRKASENLLHAVRSSSGLVGDFDGILSVSLPSSSDIPRIAVREKDWASDMDAQQRMLRINESVDQADDRRKKLAGQASESIRSTRSSGNSLYLQWVSKASLSAAYKADPLIWKPCLDGLDDTSPSFRRSIHSAQGFYIVLCEVLLNESPELGARLWRALYKHLHLEVIGTAGIPELVHVVFRAPNNTQVLELRQVVASLAECNTDKHILDLVIAAQIHRQDAWLNELIAQDSESELTWRKRRSKALAALSEQKNVEQLHWPEGDRHSSWDTLTWYLHKWTNRQAISKYWWEKFANSTTVEEAFASWQVFLSCADRRAYAWMQSTYPLQAPHASSGLDRLRQIHRQINDHVMNVAFVKREKEAPALTEHLLFQDAPGKWLMLDCKTY